MNTGTFGHGENNYTETELRAIATIILKLVCADTKIVPAELIARSTIYERLGVTYQHEHDLLVFDEARNVYKSMSEEKRAAVKQALYELSGCDGVTSEEEKKYIEDLDM